MEVSPHAVPKGTAVHFLQNNHCRIFSTSAGVHVPRRLEKAWLCCIFSAERCHSGIRSGSGLEGKSNPSSKTRTRRSTAPKTGREKTRLRQLNKALEEGDRL
ncbi:hypothetical protein AOLI_G00080440 [Acnodon oligacanthus]